MQPQQPINNQQGQPQPLQNAFQSKVPTGPLMNGAVPLQPLSAAQMAALPKKHSVKGLVFDVILVLLLIGASAFGIWAYLGRQDFKNNSDQKSQAAVEKALEEQKVVAEAEFAEREKAPYVTYTGPAASGSLKLTYPKTWSAQIIDKGNNSSPVVGYFQPGYVPSTVSGENTFALRLEVTDISYDQVLAQFDASAKDGKVKIAPQTLPKVSGVMGARVSGRIETSSDKIDGTLLVFPLRDKTVKIWTESNASFLNDLETVIIPNVTFIP